MKITFLHVIMLIAILFFTLTIGYLLDTLFNEQWYGYLAVGLALSFFLHINAQQKPFMAETHPYLRYGALFLVLLLIFSALGFLGKVLFGIDFYKPLLFGFVMTFVMYFNQRKTTIKKQ